MSELNFTHSNGNKVKLATPDTLAANKTFKLPGADGSSGQFLKTDGSGALSFATPTNTIGLTDFDTWYLTSDLTGNTNPIVNNWSRWDRYGGTGTVTFAAPSSGIWIFPSTGYWKIEYVGRFRSNGNSSERGCNASIYVATDGSNYNFATQSSTNLHKADDNTNISRGHTQTSYIFDVTSTSTHKMKVDVGYQQRQTILEGHGAYLYTHIRFMKLGET